MKDSRTTWLDYKALCDRADVFTRWALQETARLLKASQSENLARVLDDILLVQKPHKKPQDHMGDDRVDTFTLKLPVHTVGRICSKLASVQSPQLGVNQIEADQLKVAGIESQDVHGLSVAWQEYHDLQLRNL